MDIVCKCMMFQVICSMLYNNDSSATKTHLKNYRTNCSGIGVSNVCGKDMSRMEGGRVVCAIGPSTN